jgi:hypothetical protein
VSFSLLQQAGKTCRSLDFFILHHFPEKKKPLKMKRALTAIRSGGKEEKEIMVKGIKQCYIRMFLLLAASDEIRKGGESAVSKEGHR